MLGIYLGIKKILVPFLIFIVGIGIYYFIYVLLQKINIDEICKNEIYCIKLEFADYLAILVAIIGLIYVIKSIDSWKNEYKFQTAILTMKSFDEIIYLTDFLTLRVHKLINDAKASDFYNLDQFESEFFEKIEHQEFQEKILKLKEKIFNEKNNLHQEDFEKLIEDLDGFYSFGMRGVIDSHLSEANYTENQEFNRKVKRTKVESLNLVLKEMKKKSKKIVINYNHLRHKLHFRDQKSLFKFL